MKYIINIDKSSYGNPSEDLRQYEIDIDVLRRKGNVYDSLIIDDTARVIRRIEHKNGEDYILENPIIENLSMIKIELFQGVNYIYVTMDGEILSTSTIVIDYLLKNDFTETYPTVIEMHSAIEQSASNIILQVERKADADKIISLINLSPEEITIDSNRISLKGKEINLTSDNVIITSNNFSVNKNGDMTCTNANISGKVTATSGKIAGYTIDGNMLVGANIGMSGLSGEGWGFWAGSDTPGSAPFRVGHNGQLICSNAIITDGNIDGGVVYLRQQAGQQAALIVDASEIQNITKIDGSSISITSDAIVGQTAATKITAGAISTGKISTGTISTVTISTGTIEISGNNFLKGSTVNLLREYNTTTALGDGRYETGIWGSEIKLKTGVSAESWLVVNGNLRPGSNKSYNLGTSSYYWSNIYTTTVSCGGSIYADSGAIRSKNTYDNDTVTNSPNMYVTSNGWFRRTTNTSSYKVKKDIKRYKKENDINEELNPEKLYDVKVWQFKYRDEYFKNKNDKRYDKDLIGFILEDMAQKYPIAVDYDEDENGIPRPESWNSQYLIPAMLYLIQEQHKEIEELKSLMKGE